MRSQQLLDLLRGNFETEGFPVEECNIQDDREPTVHNSDSWYLCLLADKRFSGDGGMRVLHPYTAQNSPEAIEAGEPEVLYGWVDKWGNISDHRDRQVHCDDLVVVAWKRLPGPTDLRDLTGLEKTE